jgi:hypothetical protein
MGQTTQTPMTALLNLDRNQLDENKKPRITQLRKKQDIMTNKSPVTPEKILKTETLDRDPKRESFMKDRPIKTQSIFASRHFLDKN